MLADMARLTVGSRIGMATFEKDINESSEKIDKVKRIVQDGALVLEYKNLIPQTPIAGGVSWKELKFSYSSNTLKIGMVFSGIGAIEHAFQQLGVSHQIMFADYIELKCKQSYFANYDIKEEDRFTDIPDFDAHRYKGCICHVMYGKLNELRHDVKFRLLNSCDYGIPKHHERVYGLSNSNGRLFRNAEGTLRHATNRGKEEENGNS